MIVHPYNEYVRNIRELETESSLYILENIHSSFLNQNINKEYYVIPAGFARHFQLSRSSVEVVTGAGCGPACLQ